MFGWTFRLEHIERIWFCMFWSQHILRCSLANCVFENFRVAASGTVGSMLVQWRCWNYYVMCLGNSFDDGCAFHVSRLFDETRKATARNLEFSVPYNLDRAHRNWTVSFKVQENTSEPTPGGSGVGVANMSRNATFLPSFLNANHKNTFKLFESLIKWS